MVGRVGGRVGRVVVMVVGRVVAARRVELVVTVVVRVEAA